jgi:hypothetical protein
MELCDVYRSIWTSRHSGWHILVSNVGYPDLDVLSFPQSLLPHFSQLSIKNIRRVTIVTDKASLRYYSDCGLLGCDTSALKMEAARSSRRRYSLTRLHGVTSQKTTVWRKHASDVGNASIFTLWSLFCLIILYGAAAHIGPLPSLYEVP